MTVRTCRQNSGKSRPTRQSASRIGGTARTRTTGRRGAPRAMSGSCSGCPLRRVHSPRRSCGSFAAQDGTADHLPAVEPDQSRPRHIRRRLDEWTDGRALIATGIAVRAAGTRRAGARPIAQCNNVYIFPAMGLAVTAAEATRVTDEMMRVAAASARGRLARVPRSQCAVVAHLDRCSRHGGAHRCGRRVDRRSRTASRLSAVTKSWPRASSVAHGVDGVRQYLGQVAADLPLDPGGHHDPAQVLAVHPVRNVRGDRPRDRHRSWSPRVPGRTHSRPVACRRRTTASMACASENPERSDPTISWSTSGCSPKAARRRPMRILRKTCWARHPTRSPIGKLSSSLTPMSIRATPSGHAAAEDQRRPFGGLALHVREIEPLGKSLFDATGPQDLGDESDRGPRGSALHLTGVVLVAARTVLADLLDQPTRSVFPGALPAQEYDGEHHDQEDAGQQREKLP